MKVVRLLVQGLTYKEIAAQLFVSPRTIETHVTHVFSKLGCKSRAQLRAEVARHSSALVSPD
jgi:DNA-binding CsgD family transcriptional regulator